MLQLQPSEIQSYLRQKGLKLRNRGNRVEAEKCPFCKGGEHKDYWKFVVYLDTNGGNYKCMRGSCDQSGSFWQLLEFYGDNPQDYYKTETFGKPRTTKKDDDFIAPSLKPNLTFPKHQTESYPLTETAVTYLQKRGFRQDILEDLAIWCDKEGHICLGYYHKNELCMVKVRQPRKPAEKEQKTWQQWKGGLRTLYGLEQCDFSLPYILITFGEYDRIACYQSGIDNAVSVPCGDSDLEWINVCYEQLKSLNEIYLWIDNDESGLKALPKIADRLGREKIKVVRSEFKDANEMLLMRSREVGISEAEKEIFALVGSAEWYVKGDLIDVADIAEQEQCWEGYTSGIPFLDKNLGGYLKGQLTVHIGDSKAGKSTALNQAIAQAVLNGGKVCVWTGEDTPEDFKYKLAVHIANFEGTETRTAKSGIEYSIIKDEFKPLVNDFVRNRVFLIDKRFGLNEETLLHNFQLAYERFGCDVFVVDNLMKLVLAKETNNYNMRQASVCNMLSDFVKTTKTHVHLVSHTKKGEKADENKPPTSKNAPSGAKEIVNLCDSAIFWWRVPEAVKSEYNFADALVGIVANRRSGDEGMQDLVYDKQTRTLAESQAGLARIKYLI